MQKLADAFDGDWNVTDTFEVSASQRGKTRRGIASFRLGPGVSLIEDYQSNGSAGELKFFALLWWDQSARVYRLLPCAGTEDGKKVWRVITTYERRERGQAVTTR